MVTTNSLEQSPKLLGRTQKSKIQRQLLLLLLLSTIVPATIVGAYGATVSNRALSESLLEDFEEDTLREADVLDEFLESAYSDVEFLEGSYLLQGLVDSEKNGGIFEGISQEDWKKLFKNDVTTMLESHPEYSHIRYVDKDGQEVVSVLNQADASDSIQPIDSPQLVDLSTEPYIQTMLALGPNESYVTQFDAEQAEANEGMALIHYGASVFDRDGNNQGVVIIDVPVASMVERLEAAAELEVGETEGIHDALLDAEGVFISAHTGESEDGETAGDGTKEFVHETGESFSEAHSADALAEILSGEEGVVRDGEFLIAYSQTDPNPAQEGEELYIIKTFLEKDVYGPARDFRNVAMLVTLLSLAVTIPLGIWRGRQLLGILEQLINGISTSSQQIFSTIAEQERIATQQAASVSETSITMDELEASSRQSAEQALAAVNAAKTALDRAEVGSSAVDETLAGMFILEQKVDAIAQQIVSLSGQADEIGSISQTVSDFASQTNMLALNSSVEAVRAGEHGKGFAIVANEIRKLSEQSQRSADRIKTLVAEIQKLINQTVMVTEEGTKTAKSGVRIAKQTEQAFDEIKQSIDAVVLNNQQVSLNQKQQVDAIRQVVTAMENIDRSSKESATGLSQTRTGTEQLSQTANSLREIM